MRIVHVISDSIWGGAGSYLATLLEQLDTARFQPMVICPHQSQLLPPLRELGIETFTYGQGERSFHPADVRAIYTQLKRLSPQLVHTHASLSGRVAARLLRIPTIYTKHGLSDISHSRAAAWGHRLLPAGVIAVSAAVGRQLYRGGIPAEDVIVIHNGVDGAAVRQRAQDGAAQLEALTESSGPRFAYAGRLSPEKGPDLLVTAAQEVIGAYPDARFFLFGEGPLRQELGKMIAEANLQKQVVLYGFVPNLPAFLTQCHLLVLPSRSEGLPLAVLEAMALGVPVIATNVGGIPELVVDDVSGRLVPPEDAKALARAMMAIWQDTGWRERAAREGRQAVDGRFSATAMAQSTLAFYQQRWEVKHRG